MKKIVIALLLSVLLTGCISTGTKMDATALVQLKKSMANEAEVVEIFGKPYTKTLDFNGNVIATYENEYIETRKKDRVLPYISRIIWGLEPYKQTLTITYDDNGRLIDYTFAHTTSTYQNERERYDQSQQK